MALNDLVVQLQLHLNSAKEHVAQLEAGRKVSSAKCRSDMMKIRNLANDVRKGCLISQKSIPVKKRVKVTPIEPAVEVPAPEPEPVVVAPVKKSRKLKSSN